MEQFYNIFKYTSSSAAKVEKRIILELFLKYKFISYDILA